MRFTRQVGRGLQYGLGLKLGIAFGVWALAASTVFEAPAEAAQPGRLSGATIEELVRGATVNMHTPLGTVVPVKYAEDGTLSGKTSGMVAYYLGASQDRGRWWIKGRRLCQQWKTWFSAKPKCIEIRRQGQKFHWKDREGKTGVATLVGGSKAIVAKAKQRAALKRQPTGLGLAAAPVTALPETRSLTKPARKVVARAALMPRRKVAPTQQYVAFSTPPPLPARPASRNTRVKLSSWTMRAQ